MGQKEKRGFLAMKTGVHMQQISQWVKVGELVYHSHNETEKTAQEPELGHLQQWEKWEAL